MNNNKGNTPKPSGKEECSFTAFIKNGSKGLNTLEANAEYNDTALHTTVSDIKRNRGIVLDRKTDPYTNKQGRTTLFKRYWLNKKDIPKAKRIVNALRAKRGATQLYEIEGD